MKRYSVPRIYSQKSFDTSALACAKTTDPPPGGWHFVDAYDTFTGHRAGGFSGSESVSGAAGLGFGPGGSSMSYYYTGLCSNWILYAS